MQSHHRRAFLTRYAVSVLLLSFVFISSPAQALDDSRSFNRYQRQTWQVENGLPQDTVHAILQTRNGYLWLATEGGAVRFDGIDFTIYNSQNTPQLQSNDIRSLFEDDDAALWFSTPAGLSRLRDGEWKTFTIADGLPTDNIYSLHKDFAGHLWALTPEGLARYSNGRFQAFPLPGGSSLNALADGWNGAIWLGTPNGLKLFSSGHYADANLPASLPNAPVNALLRTQNGDLWIGTATGLYVYDGTRVRAYTTQDGMPGKRITAIYEDRQSTIWLSTDGGLARIVGGKIEPLPASDPLSSSIVLSIFEDREGDLWLGTESQGLTVLRDALFTTYAARNGLPGDLVRCVFADRRGTLWIGTNGGLGRFQDGRFSILTTAGGLSSNLVFALAEDPNGDLLIGTPDGLDILHRDNGRIRVLTSADGLPDDFVRSIHRDADGSIWIGTRHGLSHWQHGRFRTYTQSDGLGSDFVGTVLRDSRGTLWVGTLGGLSRLENGAFINLTKKQGLASDVITALHEDGEGRLWIGTQGGGLHRMQNGKIVHYDSKLDLPATIYAILEDASAHLWIASKIGIYRVDGHQLNLYADGRTTTVDAVRYGTSDGLRVNECTGGGHPAAWKTRNGQLWFSTLKGASVFDSRRTKLNRLPPLVVVESITVNGGLLHPESSLQLDPGSSRLVFEYAGLSFAAPGKVRFKYKLVGFDHDWIEAGAQRTAYYTNIPPGRYNFHVIARNGDGVWNTTGASLPFTVRPHYYQTYWFYLSVAFALTLLGYGIYRLRVNQVQLQFNAVLGERNRIAREIHDTLAQGFVAVSVQLELVSRLISISSEAAQEQLERARELVHDGLDEARRSIWELRSQATANDDFAARLSKSATRIIATAPIKWNLQVHGAYRPLPAATETELLRIAGEAITNVVRHAHAANVQVDLIFDPKKFRMTIADDGRGFQGEPTTIGVSGHFGLQGMRERAKSIGAKLTVNSAPGQGTTVAVEAAIN